jgi:hypothetical protein
VRLANVSCSTVDVEQTLQAFVSTLRIFEDHERQLHEELRQSAPVNIDTFRAHAL